MKILVIGRKRNGKGEFSKMLANHLPNTRVKSTTDYLIHRTALLHGVSREEIHSNKEKWRPLLIGLGNTMCDLDPGSLVSICLLGIDTPNVIVDGVRRRCEFDVVKGWFDHIIWVERQLEDDGEDNCELNHGHASLVVANSGDLTDLNRQASLIALKLREVPFDR